MPDMGGYFACRHSIVRAWGGAGRRLARANPPYNIGFAACVPAAEWLLFRPGVGPLA